MAHLVTSHERIGDRLESGSLSVGVSVAVSWGSR